MNIKKYGYALIIVVLIAFTVFLSVKHEQKKMAEESVVTEDGKDSEMQAGDGEESEIQTKVEEAVKIEPDAAEEKEWELTEEMKQQGVFETSSGQWFFRITDEQFEELKKSYIEGVDWERRQAESYTYEELFGAGYVDDELYAEIEDICKSIDWTVSFDPGDVTKYALYKEKFKNFIDGETTVWIKETGEELPIYDLSEFRTDIELEKFDIDRYSYYFFDMNGDEAPELCVTDKARYIYVFQYDEERDQIVLWEEYISSTIFLMGTQKLGFAGGTAGHGLISIDENGDRVFFVRFKEVGGGPYRNDIEDYGYLVSLPEYIELKDYMIEQAVYDKTDERFYFRVTEEQFEELTKDYNDAVKKAQDALDEVTYTYTELFE